MAALLVAWGVVVSGCMTHATATRDALRYPPAPVDGPIALAVVDDEGEEREFEVRPDTHVTLRLARRTLDLRAREMVIGEDALVVRPDDGERARRIPWNRVRGADVSEPRPWLAFAVVVAGTAVAGTVLLLAGSAP